MTHAERYQWIVEFLVTHGLLRAQFCQPEKGMKAGDYWVLHPPYMIDASRCLGYAKTAEGAIDAAAESEPAVRELTGAEAEQAWAAATRPGDL